MERGACFKESTKSFGTLLECGAAAPLFHAGRIAGSESRFQRWVFWVFRNLGLCPRLAMTPRLWRTHPGECVSWAPSSYPCHSC